MYPKINLYRQYIKNLIDAKFSSDIPNVTTRITLEHMHYAMNLSESWDHCMDIGGGSGHYLTAFSGFFKRATLVEVDYHVEHELVKQRHPNIEIVESFIEKYEPKEKIDFILLADLYEHIPDIKKFVGKIASMQEHGGVVYIMTPNPIKCGPAPESGIYHTLHPNGHIKHYPTQEINNLMREHGYELIFKLFEEGPFRKKIKYIIYGLARRDKNFSKNFLYRIIRPLILLVVWPLLFIFEKVAYHVERKHRFDQYTTTTQNLAYKKIYAS